MNHNPQSFTSLFKWYWKRLLVLWFFLFSLSAQASLIGDSIIGCFAPLAPDGSSLCQLNPGNNLFINGTAVVQEELNGQEFSGSFGLSERFIADVDSGSILIGISSLVGGFFLGGAPSEFFFDDLDWIEGPGKIIGVTIKSEDDMELALNPFLSITFTGDSISIKLDANIPMLKPIRAATLQIQAEHLPSTIYVSEPNILFLFMLGISPLWIFIFTRKPRGTAEFVD